MDWDTADMYWRAITVIEAQDALIQLKVAQFPYMKKGEQRKVHRHFHQLAYPKTYEAPLTTGELADRLRKAIHG